MNETANTCLSDFFHYLSIFLKLREHYNDSTFSFVNHLPKVCTGFFHGSLCYDELLTLLVSLKKFTSESNSVIAWLRLNTLKFLMK